MSNYYVPGFLPMLQIETFLAVLVWFITVIHPRLECDAGS